MVWSSSHTTYTQARAHTHSESHNVGAVGCLREIKSAISVARNVMERTGHTFLVGDLGQFTVTMVVVSILWG